MGTTTGGLSWPATNAAIRDGATAIRTLAEQVEARYGTARVAFTNVVVTTNSQGDVSVPWTGKLSTCAGAVVEVKNVTESARVTTLSNGTTIGCRIYTTGGVPAVNYGPIELYAVMWGS